MDLEFKLRQLIEGLEISKYMRDRNIPDELSARNNAILSWIDKYASLFRDKWRELEGRLIKEIREKGRIYIGLNGSVYRINYKDEELIPEKVKKAIHPYDFSLESIATQN